VLDPFENALVEAVEPDRHGVLSVVLTTAAKREFVFHTSDVPGFIERLTNMPQRAEPYPIEIHHNHDPRWDYFDAVVSNTS